MSAASASYVGDKNRRRHEANLGFCHVDNNERRQCSTARLVL